MPLAHVILPVLRPVHGNMVVARFIKLHSRVNRSYLQRCLAKSFSSTRATHSQTEVSQDMADNPDRRLILAGLFAGTYEQWFQHFSRQVASKTKTEIQAELRELGLKTTGTFFPSHFTLAACQD